MNAAAFAKLDQMIIVSYHLALQLHTEALNRKQTGTKLYLNTRTEGRAACYEPQNQTPACTAPQQSTLNRWQQQTTHHHVMLALGNRTGQ